MDSLASALPGNYQYPALPPDPAFRYLILKPGQGNEALECSLHICLLDEALDYESISYVWGLPTSNQTILCDNRVLKITQSLANVLYQMRLPSEPRTLWADSICINQEDSSEKGRQVILMANIYRGAKRTLIYLGNDEEGHANDAIELVEEVNRMVETNCKRTDGPWALFPYPNPDDPILSDIRWKSVAALYSCVWFYRGWVVQEVGLAKQSLAIWGQHEVSWPKLMRVDAWVVFRASRWLKAFGFGIPGLHSQNYFTRHQNEARFFWQAKVVHSVKLLDTLESARVLGLTDARDRIYAFLELLTIDDKGVETGLKLLPNYEQSFLEVYKDFAMQHIRTKRKVELLDYVQHTQETLDTELPSWVPRWDSPPEAGSRLYIPHWDMLTDRSSSVHSPSFTGTKLNVRAVVLDSVVYASEALHAPHIMLDDITKIWEAIAKLEVGSPYPLHYRLHAFVETLHEGISTGNLQDQQRDQAAYLLDIHRKAGEVEVINSQYWEEKAKGGDIKSYNALIQMLLRGKRIFLTQRGYFGIADGLVREGDRCGIIFGCKMLSILWSAEAENSYRLLGGAYITGNTLQISEEKLQTFTMLGCKESKEWTEWDVEEEDILLC